MALFDIYTPERDHFDWSDIPFSRGGRLLLPGSAALSLHSGWGNMHFHYYPAKKYTLFINVYATNARRRTIAGSDGDNLEFTFMLGSPILNKIGGFEQQWVQPMQYNLGYLPGYESKSFLEKDHFYVTMDIHFKREYLEELCLQYPDQLSPLLEHMDRRKAYRLNQLPYYADLFLKETARRILACLRSGGFRPAALDREVATLMSHVLNPHISMNRQAMESGRRQLLNEVYGLLTRDLLEMPAVGRLQKEAGMSATRLRELFKATFGQTMREVWVKRRMDEALCMVAYEREKKIREIGSEVGFLSVSNFSKAFISTYGMSPRKVRGSIDFGLLPGERLFE